MIASNPIQETNLVNRIALPCLLSAISILFLTPVNAAVTGSHGNVKLAWNSNPESNIASYKIHLGFASGDYPEVLDVGNVTETEVSGLTPGATYYCAVQACNTEGLTSKLSVEISFAIPMHGVAYDQWAASGGLNGSDAAPSATPFHDGVQNLLKFAFNMNASGPDNRVMEKEVGTSGLPKFGLEKTGSETWFTVEFIRRKDGGLVYIPKTSTDIENFLPMPGSPVITDVDAQWERVVVRMPCNPSITPALFGRVEVMLP